ncbi:MAG: SHOCT domain-containing protein [Myxococcales bacterium]|nr:SHOCT domain-containing protein [Myxococcales bacterium]
MGRAILITILLLVAMVFVSSVAAGVAGENSSLLVSSLFILCTAIWAATDASKIEINKYKTGLSGPVAIFFGAVILWIIVFPWYLAVRKRVLAGEVPLKATGAVPQAAVASSIPFAPSQAVSPPSSSGLSSDALAQLEKLAQLKEKGVLTEEEFSEQKKKLLSM